MLTKADLKAAFLFGMYAGNKHVRERVDAELEMAGVTHPYIEELRDILTTAPAAKTSPGFMISQWFGRKRANDASKWVEDMVSSTISQIIRETKLRDMQRKLMQIRGGLDEDLE